MRKLLLAPLLLFIICLVATPSIYGEVSKHGSFSYSIPIDVPPGIMGVQPHLSLDYNSGAGNGPLGMGWQISGLRSISRITWGNAPTHNGIDAYTSVYGRLVYKGDRTYTPENTNWSQFIPQFAAENAPGIPDGESYAPESPYTAGYTTESPDFSNCKNFIFYVNLHKEPCTWQETDQNGNIYIYGKTPDSQIVLEGHDIRNGFSRWNLSELIDPHGNRLAVSYASELWEDGESSNPTSIQYGEGTHEVSFEYGTREDQLPSESKFGETFKHRLEAIHVYSAGIRVRTYTLTYSNDNDLKISRLTHVKEYGKEYDPGSTSNVALNTHTFDWTEPESDTNYPFKASQTGLNTQVSSDLNIASLDIARIKYGDFNGDGRTDLYYMPAKGTCLDQENDRGHIRLANVDGTFSGTFDGLGNGIRHCIRSSDEEAQLDYNSVRFLDFNGDGRTDIYSFFDVATRELDTQGQSNTYYTQDTIRFSNNYGDFYSLTQTVPDHRLGFERNLFAPDNESSETKSTEMARIKFGDFNGDGLTDLLESNFHPDHFDSPFDYFNSTPDSCVSRTVHLYGEIDPADPADPTDEIVSAFTESSINLRVTCNPGDSTNKLYFSRDRLVDFNGDGRVDIHHIGKDESVVILAPPAGTNLAAKVPSRVTVASSNDIQENNLNMSRIKYGDFNGDGLTDIYLVQRVTELNPQNQYCSTGQIYLTKKGRAVDLPGSSTVPLSHLRGAPHCSVPDDAAKDQLLVNEIQMGDFNGDGRTDIYRIMHSEDGSAVLDEIYLANSDGTISTEALPGLTTSIDTSLDFSSVNYMALSDQTPMTYYNQPQSVVSHGTLVGVATVSSSGTTYSTSQVAYAATSSSTSHGTSYYGVSALSSSIAAYNAQVDTFNAQLAAYNTNVIQYNTVQTQIVTAEGARRSNADISRIQFGDFNGDGKTDIYYIQSANDENTMDDVYLAGAGHHLIKTITEPTQSVIHIDYQSVQELGAIPTTVIGKKTPNKIPRMLVSRVSKSDGRPDTGWKEGQTGNLHDVDQATRYGYTGGYQVRGIFSEQKNVGFEHIKEIHEVASTGSEIISDASQVVSEEHFKTISSVHKSYYAAEDSGNYGALSSETNYVGKDSRVSSKIYSYHLLTPYGADKGIKQLLLKQVYAKDYYQPVTPYGDPDALRENWYIDDYTYDDQGRALTIKKWIVGAITKITTNTYAEDWKPGDRWPMNQPDTVVVRQYGAMIDQAGNIMTDEAGNSITPDSTILSALKYTYGSMSEQEGLSKAPHLLLKTEALKCENANDCTIADADLDTSPNWVTIKKDLRYDQWGHPSSVKDAKGSLVETTYNYAPEGAVCTGIAPHRTVTTKSVQTNLSSIQYFNADGTLLSTRGANTGDTTCYTYDQYGRPKTVSNALKGITKLDYNVDHNTSLRSTLVTVLDHDSNDQGIVSYKTDYMDGFGFAYRTHHVGDSPKGGSITSIVHRKKYFDTTGEIPTLVRETSLPSSTSTIEWIKTTYDTMGRRATRTRPNAPVPGVPNVVFSYGKHQATITENLGSDSKMFDKNGNEVSQIVTKEFFSPRKQLIKKVDGLHSRTDGIDELLEETTTYEYDGAGRLVYVTLPKIDGEAAQTTHVAYNSLGQRTKIIDPSLGVNHYTYDNAGNLKTIIDERDATVNVTTHNYDTLDRITDTSRSYQRGTATFDEKFIYEYDLSGEEFGSSLGRLSRVTTQQGERSSGTLQDQYKVTHKYDNMGNLIQNNYWYEDGRETSESFVYTEQSRLESMTLPDFVKQQFGYTTYGNLEKLWLEGEDPLYESTESNPLVLFGGFNDAQRFTKKTYGNNTKTTYAYDAESGRLTQLEALSSNGATLQSLKYDFNSAGYLKSIVDLRTDSNDYFKVDVDGKRINTNATQTFQYDQAGRLTDVDWPSLSDPQVNSVSRAHYQYDAIGNLRFRHKTYSDGTAKKEISEYDGQKIKTVHETELDDWTTGPAQGDEVVKSMEYDSVHGNLIQKITEETKDIWIPITVGSVTTFIPGTREGSVQWNYDYNAANQLIGIKKDDRQHLEFAYNHVGQRVKKTFYPLVGSPVTTWYISPSFEIRQDADGVLSSTKHIIAGGHGKVATINGPYAPNATAPVTAMNAMSGTNGMLPVGTITEFLENSSGLSSFNGTSMTFISNASRWGDLVSGLEQSRGLVFMLFAGLLSLLLWNKFQAHRARFESMFPAWQRMAAISIVFVFTLASCASDPVDQSSSDSDFQVLSQQLSSDFGTIGSTSRLSGSTVAGLTAGIFYYHTNHIGSSAVITDQSGHEVSRIAYEPFGKVDQERSVGVDSVTHKYTGQELDEESGLYYYNARYYDPSVGRFITADTIIPDPTNVQAFNRYAYVLNNPIRYNDPTGHRPLNGHDSAEQRDRAEQSDAQRAAKDRAKDRQDHQEWLKEKEEEKREKTRKAKEATRKAQREIALREELARAESKLEKVVTEQGTILTELVDEVKSLKKQVLKNSTGGTLNNVMAGAAAFTGLATSVGALAGLTGTTTTVGALAAGATLTAVGLTSVAAVAVLGAAAAAAYLFLKW